jgi:hypothetical protein
MDISVSHQGRVSADSDVGRPELGRICGSELNVKRETGALWEPEFANALIEENRHKLIPWFKSHARKRKPSGDEMARLLGMGKASVLREVAKGTRSDVQIPAWRKTKARGWEYHRVRDTAELLRPAIFRLLIELDSGTTHTVPEILQYLRKDCREACEFLLRHINRLHQALNDPGPQGEARSCNQNTGLQHCASTTCDTYRSRTRSRPHSFQGWRARKLVRVFGGTL